MKKFKLGFLTIVGLLAMSFTLVPLDQVFIKNTLLNDSGTCDQNIDLKCADYYINISCNGQCGVVTCVNKPINHFICKKTIQTDPTFECEGGNILCCIGYLPNQNCIPPDVGTKDRITKVICKSK